MYQIKLEKDDFLRFMLFTASKSKTIKAKRIRSWIIITVLFLCLGLIFLSKEDKLVSYYFLVVAGLNVFLYPFYNRWRYKKYYESHIQENYKSRIGVTSQVEFVDEYIISKDYSGEEKLRLTEISFIYEIKDDLFIRMKNGGTIVVPSKMADYEGFKSELAKVTENLGIIWTVELNWKWK